MFSSGPFDYSPDDTNNVAIQWPLGDLLVKAKPPDRVEESAFQPPDFSKAPTNFVHYFEGSDIIGIFTLVRVISKVRGKK